MTRKERVLAALRAEKLTPRPVGAVTQSATVELMDTTGASWPDAHSDPGLMAALAGGACEALGFDLARVPFDQTIEAELFGCPVSLGSRDEICAVSGSLCRLEDGPPALPDPGRGRARVVAEAVALLRDRFRSEMAVLGGVVGPFTVAGHLLGISQLLVASLTKPQAVEPFLDAAFRFAVQYAARQVEAGADAIVVEDMAASLDLTSPKIYRNVVLPWQKRLVEAIRVPVILHICGNNTRILQDLVATGARALSLDAKTDLAAAAAAAQGRCAIVGGVPPIEALLSGTPDTVRAASRESLAAGVHILAPGCGIPPRASGANLKVLVETALEWKD